MSSLNSTVSNNNEAMDGDKTLTAEECRRPSVVFSLVPLILLPPLPDSINATTTIDNSPTTPTISPVSPPPPLPHNSLFPILTTTVTTPTVVKVTPSTLWECQSVGSDASLYGVDGYDCSNSDTSFGSMEAVFGDSSMSAVSVSSAIDTTPNTTTITPPTPDRRHPPHREREVSSMGSSSSGSIGRSRSGLRLAKKERRQKAKDGHAGAEAFAGDALGGSCEDEGMTEIVVVSTPSYPSPDRFQSDWASPILEPVNPLVEAHIASSSRSSLRRGKRDLMRSWLDTPVNEEVGQFSSDGTIGSSITGAMLPHPILARGQQGIIKCGMDPLIAVTEPPPSPTYNVLPTNSLQSSISPSSGQLSPTESCSSLSVRHSRPRETIRSIQAMRSSASSSLILPTSLKTFAPLDIQAVSVPIGRRPPHPPTTSMSSSSSSPHKLSKVTKQHQQASRYPCNDGGLQPETTPPEVIAENVEGSGGSVSTTASLSLHPGPKPRNVVTFNTDAYNLDAWDADVMGLFALPTEGVTTVDAGCSKEDIIFINESTSNPQLLSWSYARPLVSQEADDSTQSSFSVLTAYFEQSRSGTHVVDLGKYPSRFNDQDKDSNIPSHGHPNDGGTNTSTHQYVANGEADGPSEEIWVSGVEVRQCWQPSVSPLSTWNARCFPENNGSSKTSPKTIFNHLQKGREYLLSIHDDHVDSSVPPILVTPRPHMHLSPTKVLSGKHITIENSVVVEGSTLSFSDIVSKFVTVDTLVHKATSYTEQLANPTSGTGHNKRDLQDRWEVDDVKQQQTTTTE